MLKAGMVIAERYEILEQIGTGGMADVYKAMDHKLNRQVAVKVLKPEFREDKTFIRKFRSEAQAAAGLMHPNIVNVYDVGDDEGVYYIVMELIEGITLKEYISKKGKLSIKEATSIAIQVSMGLEAAHSHGIVHRDVKPQNIIISTDGKVKVTDFGIARAASSNTISSNVMGSVHYSSPEQVRGGYSDEKSDIYSLGITIYEMVTGKVPFDGDTTVAIAIKHLQEEIVPPSAYTPELPYSLEQIIYKCTQKSVDRRYPNMGEVIADLKHSLIDPQGDFVKLTSVDNEAKTRVIGSDEVDQIKKSSKQNLKNEALELEKELREENDDEDEDEAPQRQRETKKRKKRRSRSRILPIIGMILGAALLIAAIYFIAREAGLLDRLTGRTTQTEEPSPTPTPVVDTSVAVPDLIGKTESEAKDIAQSMALGVQMMGEEPSTQEKGRISRTDPAAGTQVQQNTTLQYYISSGTPDVELPDMVGLAAVEVQDILESQGLNVAIENEYSELDDDGYALVEPGYVSATNPVAGTTVSGGGTVTLTVSRGRYYEDGAEVPSVVGMTKNDALTTLGKWLTINVEETESSDHAPGEVIAQSLEAQSIANPDEPITITVCASAQAAAPVEEQPVQTETAEQVAVNTDSGEVWKCNQRLNTPEGYSGGPVRLELVQEVNGQLVASVVIDGEQIEFPYQLDLTGVSGVSTGTIHLLEQVNGTYEELGHYPISFSLVE
ncbi:MAG: Stk1 family PASTA domain-containing Ser/Thr kinase [Blautia sp.]|nr:Stk1 family PASTA domain-containing Ser/Thr kinase [Blautia sp.]